MHYCVERKVLIPWSLPKKILFLCLIMSTCMCLCGFVHLSGLQRQEKGFRLPGVGVIGGRCLQAQVLKCGSASLESNKYS